MSSVRTHCLALEPNPGFPRWHSGKESACQFRRHKGSRFDTWVRGIPGQIPGGENGNHSSTLAWRILWTEETGGLQAMNSQRVGHDWVCTQHNNTRTQSFPFILLKFSRLYIYIWLRDPFWVCFCLRCKINRVNGGFLLLFGCGFFFFFFGLCMFIYWKAIFFPLNFFCTFVKH